MASKERRLPTWGGDSEVIVRQLRSDTSSWSAIQESDLDEERFVNVLYGISFFCERSGKRVESNWSALIFLDDSQQQPAIHFVETVLVDLKHFERGLRRRLVDVPGPAHLCVIAAAAQQSIGD